MLFSHDSIEESFFHIFFFFCSYVVQCMSILSTTRALSLFLLINLENEHL